jgi:signal transduction histidine kinase
MTDNLSTQLEREQERTLELQKLTETLMARNRLAELVASVALTLTAGSDLRTILQACAQAIVDHADAAFARIWTLNEADNVLELEASAGIYTHIDGPHSRVPVGKFKIGLIAEERQPHLTNGVIDDPRVSDREWARREGMVAFAGYPLMIGPQLVGVMAMFARHELTQMDLQALGAIAHGIALGIQRRRNEEALQRRADELARLAAALERSNRELDAFAYAASHDLRAPLRGIANLAQWIEEDLKDALRDETREMLQLMRGRMHRMEALIDGILQYSRAGRSHAAPETVHVGRLVREVVDLLAPPDPAAVVIADDLPVLVTERSPLQQVFLNLIGNALKYGGPHVDVRGRDAGPFYEFTVRDDGPGISPEYHDRIWGIFQTLEARDKIEAAGIGLALVKKLVEAQGGQVWVESEVGRGATFGFLWRKDG